MTFEDKLQEARQVFLTDVDDDDQRDNLERITEWEKSLRTNTTFAQWQASDISKLLIKEFKATYKNASLQLAESRVLTESERLSLWAKKDACLLVLSLIAKDAKSEIEGIKKEIDYALSST